MRSTILAFSLLLTTCAVEVDAPQEIEAGVAGAPAVEMSDMNDPVLQQDILDEQLTTVEKMSDTSSYQVEQEERGSRAAGVLLARMAVSEGTSLQPLRSKWKRDMQGILQVATNNRRGSESLYKTLGRHSPHVAKLKDYTRPRQRWTSTLPAHGIGMPELWVECTEWYMDKRKRRRGLPKGCNGVWQHGEDNWETVRSYAIKLVRQRAPERSVSGNPKTWGGQMDVWAFLKNRPHMCWLESGDTSNYFFGPKDDPDNVCKEMPAEVVAKGKAISVQIMKKDLKRSRERAEQETGATQPSS